MTGNPSEHALAAQNLSAQTLEAYERWAPLYPPTAHNPLMRAEQLAMVRHWPDVAGKRALDLACGSGRYSRVLHDTDAAGIVSMDFCIPMLRQVTLGARVCGSMMQLPFAAGSFDIVICGLALGHASSLRAWMAEISRVLTPGGTLLYSDSIRMRFAKGIRARSRMGTIGPSRCRTADTSWMNSDLRPQPPA